MKKYNMTYHASHDRETRIMDILATVGCDADEIASYIDPVTGALLHLLDNGVMFVTDVEDTTLITMWIASTTQAKKFFPGQDNLPRWFFARLSKSQQKWNKHRKSFK